MKNYLVVGAGGFIGGHLVNRLLAEGFKVKTVDIKPLEFWFQKSDKSENFSLDMSDYFNCERMTAMSHMPHC
jgi:nucleoside-diphosphate-sugar epimerase